MVARLSVSRKIPFAICCHFACHWYECHRFRCKFGYTRIRSRPIPLALSHLQLNNNNKFTSLCNDMLWWSSATSHDRYRSYGSSWSWSRSYAMIAHYIEILKIVMDHGRAWLPLYRRCLLLFSTVTACCFFALPLSLSPHTICCFRHSCVKIMHHATVLRPPNYSSGSIWVHAVRTARRTQNDTFECEVGIMCGNYRITIITHHVRVQWAPIPIYFSVFLELI